MGWLSGWQYRKSHVINPASGAGTNYQIRVKVHYGTGIDSGEDVYLNSHCRTDFGDVRFTDDDGTTLLSYYLEDKVDGDWAIFWVKVADDLSTNPATIYIYYGKSDATTTSSKADTVLNYEDFEGGTVGKFANLTSSTDYFSITSSVVKEGAYAIQANDTSSSQGSGRFSNAGTFWSLDDVKIVFWIRCDLTSTSGGVTIVYFIKNNYQRAAVGIRDTGVFQYRTSSDTAYNFGSASKNTWYKFIVKLRYSTLKWDFEIRDENDNLLYSYEDINMDSFYRSWTDVTIYSSLSAVGLSYWDNFYSLKYVKPEPSHGAWGSEESAVIIKTWTALLNTSHVFRRPFRSFKLTQTLNLAYVFIRHRFMRLTQALQTLHTWTVTYPSLILKKWFATLQTVHTLKRPYRLIQITETLQTTHAFNRPARIVKLPAIIRLIHAHFVAVPGVKRTKLFLIIGDLAIQLSND